MVTSLIWFIDLKSELGVYSKKKFTALIEKGMNVFELQILEKGSFLSSVWAEL